MWFRQLGFVTLSLMALAGFSAIIALVLTASGTGLPPRATGDEMIEVHAE